jgi:hypothetical protein
LPRVRPGLCPGCTLFGPNEMRKASVPPLPPEAFGISQLDFPDHFGNSINGRRYEIRGRDGVMEDEVPTRRQEPTPSLVVGTNTRISVVAVDEDEVTRSGRRAGGLRISDDKSDSLVESESSQGRFQQVVELGA